MPRFLTITLVMIGALCALPIIGVLSLLIYINLGRPIFYRQTRAGLGGESFMLIKFRTLRNLCDAQGRQLPDAMRMTRFGRFLRRVRLDELPELLNILRGEMALVGPRPLLPDTIEAFGPDGRVRGTVLPGLTGWAQVNGNTLLTDQEKLKLDNWYAAHRSTRLDMRILLQTLVVVTLGEKRHNKNLEVAIASCVGRRR